MTSPASPDRSLDRLHDDLQAEYAKLVDIVTTYDQRLLTIKGWGVTLSLASLGLGFQQNHYGLELGHRRTTNSSNRDERESVCATTLSDNSHSTFRAAVDVRPRHVSAPRCDRHG